MPGHPVMRQRTASFRRLTSSHTDPFADTLSMLPLSNSGSNQITGPAIPIVTYNRHPASVLARMYHRHLHRMGRQVLAASSVTKFFYGQDVDMNPTKGWSNENEE